MKPRDKLHDLTEDCENRISMLYSRMMTVVILVSLVPLCFETTNMVLQVIEYACAIVFIADYLFRWASADKKLKRGAISFLIYPFTPMALLDLLSILPTFIGLNPAFRALRVVRLFRALRAFKLLRYSAGFNSVVGIFRREKQSLLVVLGMALAYVIVSALVIYNVEPETFENYLEAIYWAALSLTTTGYGELNPVSDAGRVIAMFSSLMGIAIVALPSGIITAGLLDELAAAKEERNR